MTLYYCKKCGRIIVFWDNDEKKCDYCENPVYKVPEEFLRSRASINKELKERFINEYVKSSPVFDQNLFNSREEYAKQRSKDFEKDMAAMAHGKAILEKQVTCPYCHSTNTKKISTLLKVWSMHWLGMYSIGSIAKEWHCNNCDSDF